MTWTHISKIVLLHALLVVTRSQYIHFEMYDFAALLYSKDIYYCLLLLLYCY